MGYQKVIIQGNLGTEPEMRFTPAGSAVTKLKVAVNRKYTSNGEVKEEVEWFNVCIFGKQAESCNKFLAKGNPVMIDGYLKTRSWDGTDGQKKYMTELIANQVVFLSKGTKQEQGEEQEIEPTDIPF